MIRHLTLIVVACAFCGCASSNESSQALASLAVRAAAYEAAQNDPKSQEWALPLAEALVTGDPSKGFDAALDAYLASRWPDEPGKRQHVKALLTDVIALIKANGGSEKLKLAAADGFQAASVAK